jgi:hypothetical protein
LPAAIEVDSGRSGRHDVIGVLAPKRPAIVIRLSFFRSK